MSAPANDVPAFPGPDPGLQLADRLLRLRAWLATSRAGFDEHRGAMQALLTHENYAASISTLVVLLESAEKTSDFLAREVARASAKLAEDALAAALREAPELPKGPAP